MISCGLDTTVRESEYVFEGFALAIEVFYG